ncbi:hypothetical protein B0T16DRAFT_84475 [Cercophora newfieldiana]|uniref:Uncharacterized protein n=1 Tax=Cercophora newfieldiana TaxID=92897 RepID=A0AA39YHM5_9PEZI|nr:hypothetical protein B0T16DRAFT_84475 [Cercophora newfieldiana]
MFHHWGESLCHSPFLALAIGEGALTSKFYISATFRTQSSSCFFVFCLARGAMRFGFPFLFPGFLFHTGFFSSRHNTYSCFVVSNGTKQNGWETEGKKRQTDDHERGKRTTIIPAFFMGRKGTAGGVFMGIPVCGKAYTNWRRAECMCVCLCVCVCVVLSDGDGCGWRGLSETLRRRGWARPKWGDWGAENQNNEVSFWTTGSKQVNRVLIMML